MSSNDSSHLQCPVCFQFIPSHAINVHLDVCLLAPPPTQNTNPNPVPTQIKATSNTRQGQVSPTTPINHSHLQSSSPFTSDLTQSTFWGALSEASRDPQQNSGRLNQKYQTFVQNYTKQNQIAFNSTTNPVANISSFQTSNSPTSSRHPHQFLTSRNHTQSSIFSNNTTVHSNPAGILTPTTTSKNTNFPINAPTPLLRPANQNTVPVLDRTSILKQGFIECSLTSPLGPYNKNYLVLTNSVLFLYSSPPSDQQYQHLIKYTPTSNIKTVEKDTKGVTRLSFCFLISFKDEMTSFNSGFNEIISIQNKDKNHVLYCLGQDANDVTHWINYLQNTVFKSFTTSATGEITQTNNKVITVHANEEIDPEDRDPNFSDFLNTIDKILDSTPSSEHKNLSSPKPNNSSILHTPSNTTAPTSPNSVISLVGSPTNSNSTLRRDPTARLSSKIGKFFSGATLSPSAHLTAAGSISTLEMEDQIFMHRLRSNPSNKQLIFSHFNSVLKKDSHPLGKWIVSYISSDFPKCLASFRALKAQGSLTDSRPVLILEQIQIYISRLYATAQKIYKPSITDYILSECTDSKDVNNQELAGDLIWRSIFLSIEKHIFTPIYGTLLAYYTDYYYSGKDSKPRTPNKSQTKQKQIVKQDEEWDECIEMWRKFKTIKYPTGQILHLMKIQEKIISTISNTLAEDKGGDGKGSKGNKVLGADELVPLWYNIIDKAAETEIEEVIDIMKDYSELSPMGSIAGSGEGQYLVITVSGVFELLLRGDEGNSINENKNGEGRIYPSASKRGLEMDWEEVKPSMSFPVWSEDTEENNPNNSSSTQVGSSPMGISRMASPNNSNSGVSEEKQQENNNDNNKGFDKKVTIRGGVLGRKSSGVMLGQRRGTRDNTKEKSIEHNEATDNTKDNLIKQTGTIENSKDDLSLEENKNGKNVNNVNTKENHEPESWFEHKKGESKPQETKIEGGGGRGRTRSRFEIGQRGIKSDQKEEVKQKQNEKITQAVNNEDLKQTAGYMGLFDFEDEVTEKEGNEEKNLKKTVYTSGLLIPLQPSKTNK